MATNWDTVELGEVAVVKSGYAFKSSDWTESGVPVVKIANVKGGRLEMSGCSYVEEATARRAIEFRLSVGDILIAMTGYIGDVARVRENDLPCVLNQRVGKFSVRDPKRLDPDYLYSFLSWVETRRTIEGLGYGSAQPNVSPSLIHKVEMPLPPLPEQKAIARILGTLDDKIELNRRMNATLEAMARALFQSWFVDFDPVHAKAAGRPPSGMDAKTAALFPSAFQESEPNEIPMGWTRASLGDFASFQNGYAFKSKDWQPEGIPVVKIGSVKPGVVDLSGSSFVSPETVSGLERFKLSAGDIVVGMTGYPGEVGVVPICTPEPYLNQRVGRIAPPSAKPFLYSWIHQNARQEAFKTFVESRAYGSAQANVSGGAIMEYPVIYPGDDIARAFEALCRPLIDRILQNDSESAKLAAIRDSLLPKLLDGSLSNRFSALISD